MQNKPNLPEGKIDAKCVFTKDYENKWQRRLVKNKPNSNPIQTQSNPIQTQFKPNQTQFQGSVKNSSHILKSGANKFE